MRSAMSRVIIFPQPRVTIFPQGTVILRHENHARQAETVSVSHRDPSFRYDRPEVTMSLTAPETRRSMTAPPTIGSGKTENQSSGGRFDVAMIDAAERRSSQIA